MSAPIKSIAVTGHDCSGLTRQQREDVLRKVCGDWSLGRYVETSVGRIDRHTNPTVTVEIDYNPPPDAS